MAQKRQRAKSRRESGAFIPIPCSVLAHTNWINSSAKARAMLLDLCEQIRMKEGGPINNGDLCAAPSVLASRGWRSKEVIEFAIKELLHYGFIILTRRGDRRRPHLYAITWWSINECNNKLDVSETKTPGNDWKLTKKKWVRPRRKKKIKPDSKLESVPRFAENNSRNTVITS